MKIQKVGYCPYCDQQVTLQRKKTNHWLHFFLSIITFGGWIIIWIIAGIFSENWKCTKCGNFVPADENTENIINLYFYFIEIYIKLLAKMSIADGVSCFMEKEVLKEMIDEIIGEFEECISPNKPLFTTKKKNLKNALIDLFYETQKENNGETFDELIEQIINFLNELEMESKESLEIRCFFYDGLKKMAHADDEISIEEERLLKLAHQKLKIEDEFCI